MQNVEDRRDQDQGCPAAGVTGDPAHHDEDAEPLLLLLLPRHPPCILLLLVRRYSRGPCQSGHGTTWYAPWMGSWQSSLAAPPPLYSTAAVARAWCRHEGRGRRGWYCKLLQAQGRPQAASYQAQARSRARRRHARRRGARPPPAPPAPHRNRSGGCTILYFLQGRDIDGITRQWRQHAGPPPRQGPSQPQHAACSSLLGMTCCCSIRSTRRLPDQTANSLLSHTAHSSSWRHMQTFWVDSLRRIPKCECAPTSLLRPRLGISVYRPNSVLVFYWLRMLYRTHDTCKSEIGNVPKRAC
jgi:hypothetical protein